MTHLLEVVLVMQGKTVLGKLRLEGTQAAVDVGDAVPKKGFWYYSEHSDHAVFLELGVGGSESTFTQPSVSSLLRTWSEKHL
jgi:hypothetical protein